MAVSQIGVWLNKSFVRAHLSVISSETETEKVNKQLEDQYKHSQDHKITRWHHTGLGFSGEFSR